MLRFVPAAIFTAALFASAPAGANEFCDKEMVPLLQQRTAIAAKLQSIGKRAKQPGAREEFCSTLNAYISNIEKFLKYMEQNKDFCGVPDEAIAQAKKGLAQNFTMRKRVCLAPRQQPQQQQQGGGGGGQPAIPRPPVELRLQ